MYRYNKINVVGLFYFLFCQGNPIPFKQEQEWSSTLCAFDHDGAFELFLNASRNVMER